ncbi:hypothetical protein G9A89_005267 [Geosiphon pyriformis]|nr:hypothetical protein G9A89_005267 [Geosiphon pyriformis]
MSKGIRSVRTYNQNLNHRENRSALFNGAQGAERSTSLSSGERFSASSGKFTGTQHLDLESQNDEKVEGLTGKVKLLKEITLNLGEAVKESNNLISNMADEYSKTGNYMGGTMNRLKILAKTQSSQFMLSSSDAKERICPVCHSKCTVVELTAQLPSNLSIYFRPPVEFMEEAADVLRFQQTNLYALLRFLKNKVIKQKEVLDRAKAELIRHKDMKTQLNILKEENRKLKAEIKQVRMGTMDKIVLDLSKDQNSSPRSFHTSSTRNLRPPKTPNPPSRLSLPSTSINSPVPTFPIIEQPQSSDIYLPQQTQYEGNNETMYGGELEWNGGPGHYQGFDGGGIIASQGNLRNQVAQTHVPSTKPLYDQTQMARAPLKKTYQNELPLQVESTDFLQSQYSQEPTLSFPQPGTSAKTRISWNSIHGNTRYIARPSTAQTSSIAAPSTPRNPSRQYIFPSRSYTSTIAPEPPPRTPMTRNRYAFSGFHTNSSSNERSW